MNEGMGRREFIRTAGTAAIAASVGGLTILRPERAFGQVGRRSVEEFLDSQRRFVSWVPPVYDFYGWTNNNPQTRAGSVDYLGYAEEWLRQQSNGAVSLGTTIRGTVTERPLKDGRALVSVDLHITKALTWAVPYPGADPVLAWRNNPLLFGCRAPEVLAGATPALAEAETRWEFTNVAPGAPLPYLGFPDTNVIPDYVWPDFLELRTMAFRANAVGPLRALAGLGPEGTPGRCIITQTGVFMASGKGATADGFPAERVELRAIGA